MLIRRAGPLLALISIVVVSAIIVRYIFIRDFPDLNLESFHVRPSQTPVPTVLQLDNLLSTRTVAQIEAQEEKNCTYSMDYWIDHVERWPTLIGLGGKTYTSKDAADLFQNWRSNLASALAANLYTAMLNSLQGASMHGIETVLLEADSWLKKNIPGKNLSPSDHQRGVELFFILEAYNNGQMDPGPCEGQPSAWASSVGDDFLIMEDGESGGSLTPSPFSVTHPPGRVPTPTSTHVKHIPLSTSTATPGAVPTLPPFHTATAPAASATRASTSGTPTRTQLPPRATQPSTPSPTLSPPRPSDFPPPTRTPIPIPSETSPPANTVPPPPATATDTRGPTQTPGPSNTPRPTRTPRPSHTPRPTHTDRPG